MSAQKPLEKDRFTAFRLEGLQPETAYSVSFEGATDTVPGSFRTFPPTPSRMNVCAQPCAQQIELLRRDEELENVERVDLCESEVARFVPVDA